MRIIKYSWVIIIAVLSLSAYHTDDDIWGFYGHKLINKTAVFTLPVDLLPLYKSNLNFVIEHSVDPDKRRHASPLEAVRHYIDIDNWGTYPFDGVPRSFAEAMVKYGQLDLLSSEGDTIYSWSGLENYPPEVKDSLYKQLRHEVKIRTFELLDEKFIDLPTSWVTSDTTFGLHFSENFSSFGILPFHLGMYQRRLTNAFRNEDWPLVIKISTEIGHYISDGHVPLHTTLNYNGQLTGQDGIHAFWESRIPELFAEKDYDLFTGRAKYIDDTDAFFWEIVLSSHLLVDDVLSKEMELRKSFKSDQQYCFDERNNNTVRIECEEYAAAYAKSLDGMVESQMRKAIAAVGSCWYTAWVDGGRPVIPINQGMIADTAFTFQIDSTMSYEK